MKIKLENNRAVGVWYVRHGKKKLARASKEIIMSAGSVDSPKLLMLSGIGPKEHLKSVGVSFLVIMNVKGLMGKDYLPKLFNYIRSKQN
jgi:choline dehydrogenase